MKTLSLKIVGTTPLLMNSFKSVPTGFEKWSKEEQAEFNSYRNEDGHLYVPGYNLWRALVAGAAYSKGKGRASLIKTVAAGLSIKEMELLVGTDTFVVAQHRVVLRATGGAHIAYRARIDKWALEFTAEYDETLLNETMIRQIVKDTGQRVGVLAFRPEKKGPFGKFEIQDSQHSAAKHSTS